MNSTLVVRNTRLVLTMLSTLLLIACGGGGSGDGGASDGTVQYTGIAENAAITEQSAETLINGAYMGMPDDATIPISTYSTAELQAVSPIQTNASQNFLPLSGAFKDVTAYLSTVHEIQPQTVQTESEVIYGSCGGSATITIHIDDSNGDFNGAMQSNDYCESNTTIIGTISFSGSIDLDTLEQNSINTVSNYLVKDNNTGKVYKVENISMSLITFASYAEMSIQGGRYYHPDYGYVVPETVQPFVQYIGDIMPSSGEFTITGAQQSQAKLTVHSINDVEITADTDGDGVFEWSSGNLN